MDFIIDGHAFLNVSLNVTKNMVYNDRTLGNKYWVDDIFNEGKHLLKDQVKTYFRNFCLSYLNSLIYSVSSKTKRVHIVFDYRSWRKEYINNFFSDNNFESELSVDTFEYKANRKRNETDYLFSEYLINELVPVLESQAGINKYILKGAEGDDLIALLCESIDNDVIVYTVDSDMLQLLENKDKNVFIIYPKQRSPHKKLYVSNNVLLNKEKTSTDDFFDIPDTSITESNHDYVVNSLTNKDYVKYELDPTELILTKIFRGDKKDNISRMTKMTPKKTQALLGIINDKYGSSCLSLFANLSDDLVNFVTTEIMKLHKIKKDDQASRNDIEKHFRLNTKLILLNSKLFPDSLVKEFKEDYFNRDISQFNYSKLFEIKSNPHLT